MSKREIIASVSGANCTCHPGMEGDQIPEVTYRPRLETKINDPSGSGASLAEDFHGSFHMECVADHKQPASKQRSTLDP